jgi:hypothetical protein
MTNLEPEKNTIREDVSPTIDVWSASAADTVQLPHDFVPTLYVVVDTEEEFDWNRPFARENTGVTTIAHQIRAHAIFDRYAIKPTYVVDYPVASTAASVNVLRRLYDDGQCEIGAQLHPWVNPPFEEPLTIRNSYPGNLPAVLEDRKLVALTEAIEKNFRLRPAVYKAGRYGLGPATTILLQRHGYQADASVVPHTSFRVDGGPDFRGAPAHPFWIGRDRALVEFPLTCGYTGMLADAGPGLSEILGRPWSRRIRLPGLLARTHLLERIRLTPEGIDLDAMQRLTLALLARGQRLFSFTYHSPSLDVGHTPYVRTAAALDEFLATMDGFFRFFAERCGGRFAALTDLLRLVASLRDLPRQAAAAS